MSQFFRGSATGYCTRELVAKTLDPEGNRPPLVQIPFLDDGHWLQQGVEDFIQEFCKDPKLLTYWRESTGLLTGDGWHLEGHIDGLFDDDWLAEIKCVMDNSYQRLVKATMMEVYPQYYDQAQTYQCFPTLACEDDQLDRAVDLQGTRFFFKNRNTGHMMGGLKIDHPAYTYREDMVVPRDSDYYEALDLKLANAAEWVRLGYVPEVKCDGRGYCYYCREQGSKKNAVRQGGSVFLDYNDDEDIEQAVDFIKMRDKVSTARMHTEYAINKLTELNARQVRVEHGLTRVETYDRVALEKLYKALSEADKEIG